MLSRIRLGLLCCLVTGFCSAALSQGAAPPAAPDPTDAVWARLRQFEQVGDATPQNGAVAAVQVAGSQTVGSKALATPSPAVQGTSSFLGRADELASFRVAHSGDARVGECRRLEALMLVYAGYFGDDSAAKRRDDLVAQVRADKTLPVNDRFSLASLADNRLLRFQKFDSPQARLDLLEKTARALIAEFPSSAQAYEALLCFAKDCAEAQAGQIASDLLKMPASPAVKADAQNLLDRQALIGRSLKTLLTVALAPKDQPALAKNGITLLYAWSTGNEGSLAIAAEVAAKAPAGSAILGVNLDRDTAAAGKVAAARGLPGLLLYDAAGPNSPLARGLKLPGDNVVFITNRQGTIVSVSARPDLAAKIAAAAK